MKKNNKIIAVFIAIAISISLSGCSPAITRETAEKEIVPFMLDFIVQQEIAGTANYIQTSGQSWVDMPPNASIIVWAPPVDYGNSGYLKWDKPIKVWVYADNKLIEANDKEKTIQNYKNIYVNNSESDIWAYGYYDFGITWMSDDNQKALVYVGVSCGSLCGHGVMYTIKRNSSGKWEIKDSQDLWVS